MGVLANEPIHVKSDLRSHLTQAGYGVCTLTRGGRKETMISTAPNTLLPQLHYTIQNELRAALEKGLTKRLASYFCTTEKCRSQPQKERNGGGAHFLFLRETIAVHVPAPVLGRAHCT